MKCRVREDKRYWIEEIVKEVERFVEKGCIRELY